MFSKTMLLAFCLLLSGFVLAQSTAVLKLKDENYYSEKNNFFPDSTLSLVQQTCYDKPGTIDEEYCLLLKISFLDTMKARQMKTIHIGTDTLIANCVFDLRSAWNWEGEKTNITGTINILKWTEKTIELSFDLNIQDTRRNRTYVYNGSRVFTKTTKRKFADQDY